VTNQEYLSSCLIKGLKESSGADIKRIQTHSYDKAGS